MSFSSFSLFSFYQQPNTGIIPTSLDTGILLSGNNQSGKVAEFNWYYPYASTNILINSLLSQSRFGYYIWADSEGAVVPGLHYGVVTTNLSGTFQSNNAYMYFEDMLYGTIYPQFQDTFSEYSLFSGLITGTPHDNMFGRHQMTGLLTGQKVDLITCYNTFSGEIQSSADQMYVNSVISGIINKDIIETFTNNSSLSGIFWPVMNDKCNVNYSFIGYSIASGITVDRFTLADHENLGFSLIGYQVNS